MPIHTKLTKEEFEAIPESMRDSYKEQSDGSFILAEIPGLVDKKKVDEFRDNNRNLQQQLDEVTKKLEIFKDVDVEHFKELQEQERKLKEKELIEKGEIDTILEARIKPVVAEKDNEINTLKGQLDTANAQLSVLMIDDRTTSLATELGVEATALPDVKSRARTQFQINNGKVTAVDTEGNPVYGKDGITPLALDKSWMEGLKTNAPHLFKPAKGTGAEDGSGNRSRSGLDTSKMSSVQKIGAALNEQDEA